MVCTGVVGHVASFLFLCLDFGVLILPSSPLAS